jgi:hypothetical protein
MDSCTIIKANGIFSSPALVAVLAKQVPGVGRGIFVALPLKLLAMKKIVFYIEPMHQISCKLSTGGKEEAVLCLTKYHAIKTISPCFMKHYAIKTHSVWTW